MTVYDQDQHSCGHRLSRSTNPAMDGSYEADADVTCHACAAEAEFRKTHKDLPAGAIVRVHDFGPAELPDWTSPEAEPTEDLVED